jgi:hypothetical protein
MKQGIPYFTLKNLRDEAMTGTFYDSELSRVVVTGETAYRVEKILKIFTVVGKTQEIQQLDKQRRLVALRLESITGLSATRSRRMHHLFLDSHDSTILLDQVLSQD